MSQSNQASQGQTPEAQFIAAIQVQQERIAHLGNQITQMIQSQRSNNTIVASSLNPPKPEYFEGKNVDTFLFSLEKIFNFHNIENENKVRLAVTYFRGQP